MLFISALMLLLLAMTATVNVFILTLLIVGSRSSANVTSVSMATEPVLVVIPAKNEASVIEKTIVKLKQQLDVSDSIVVVADNCSDDTYDICIRLGVDVLQRNDTQKLGKGYAIQYALDNIEFDQFSTLVVLDADSEFLASSLLELVSVSQRHREVAQASYQMVAPKGASLGLLLSQFAWYLKNHVRPNGLSGLGLSTHLFGSGMAFPKEVLGKVSFASASIVEDRELSQSLLSEGQKIHFVADSIVSSVFPDSDKAAQTQRERWEYGYIHMLPSMLSNLFRLLIKNKDFGSAITQLDASLPPLLWWLLFSLLACAVSGLVLQGGIVFLVALLALVGLFGVVFQIFLTQGLFEINFANICLLFRYVVGRLKVLFGFDPAKAQIWTKTDRDKSDVTLDDHRSEN